MPNSHGSASLRSSAGAHRCHVLLEMRPALDGFFGIPQQTRLLFALLAQIDEVQASGLLQMSGRFVEGGLRPGKLVAPDRALHRQAQTIMSIKPQPGRPTRSLLRRGIRDIVAGAKIYLSAICGTSLKLREFYPSHFEDFVWQNFFCLSVAPGERPQVLRSFYKICPEPWQLLHRVGLVLAKLGLRSRYATLNTKGIDALIAQTPYPGRVTRGTRLIVQYHDAIPIMMPHTISDRSFHENSHYHALKANVAAGAEFVCVSESTKRDLLALYPKARATVIHNIIAPYFCPATLEQDRVPGIIHQHLVREEKLSKRHRKEVDAKELSRRFASDDSAVPFYNAAFAPGSKFLLVVSTLEPRKNHIRVIEAWQSLKAKADPTLRLVLVGNIGWDFEKILAATRPSIKAGELFLIHGLSGEALRCLYRAAAATICASVGEGFDFSGAKSMRCGGVVAASDIAVHREIYGDAAVYFDPYNTEELARVVRGLLYDKGADNLREDLRTKGGMQSAKYLPELILPKWRALLGLPVIEQAAENEPASVVPV